MVDHKSFGKTHQYFPQIDKNTYRKFYLENFVNNYFGGSFQRLVSFFAREKDLSMAEMEELIKLVEKDLNKEENGWIIKIINPK